MHNLMKLCQYLSLAACRALGPLHYLKYLSAFLKNIFNIYTSKDLKPVDRAMASCTSFSYRGKSFFYDCQYCDENFFDGTYAFGGIREIIIKDCYFKFHHRNIYPEIKTVIDLGANRGLFSTLMTTTADQIISVEVLPELIPLIRHNLDANAFRNYSLHNCFIGAGGDCDRIKDKTISMHDLFAVNHLDSVDFLKIDIEGSEFALFEHPDWLEKVKHLSMEVHPHHGDPQLILDALQHHNFHYLGVTANFQPTTTPQQIDLLYASRTGVLTLPG